MLPIIKPPAAKEVLSKPQQTLFDELKLAIRQFAERIHKLSFFILPDGHLKELILQTPVLTESELNSHRYLNTNLLLSYPIDKSNIVCMLAAGLHDTLPHPCEYNKRTGRCDRPTKLYLMNGNHKAYFCGLCSLIIQTCSIIIYIISTSCIPPGLSQNPHEYFVFTILD